MVVMVSVAVPVLDSVTDCAVALWPITVDAKLCAARLWFDVGAVGLVAVPLSPTVWGLPVALVVIVSDAVRVPAAGGVMVTEIEQLPPTARLVQQVLVWV